jgi:CheY-like chemotaxis protein
MRLYLMDSSAHPLDGALAQSLTARDLSFTTLALPDEDHEKVRALLADREAGAVFLPDMWKDLACVKIIQEIRALPGPFETVIVGPAPEPSRLVVAFNEGLGAFLETPLSEQALGIVLNRLRGRLAERAVLARRLADLERRAVPGGGHPTEAMALRDQLLARAILDLRAQRGPLVEGGARVLLVLASQAQEKRLEGFLRHAGLDVDRAPNLVEAVSAVQARSYAAVVADGVLPDGTAVDLAARLRKTIKTGIPRFIVWTSSPERVPEFLRPESYVDEVVLKPSADAGMESILLSILAGLYQTSTENAPGA